MEQQGPSFMIYHDPVAEEEESTTSPTNPNSNSSPHPHEQIRKRAALVEIRLSTWATIKETHCDSALKHEMPLTHLSSENSPSHPPFNIPPEDESKENFSSLSFSLKTPRKASHPDLIPPATLNQMNVSPPPPPAPAPGASTDDLISILNTLKPDTFDSIIHPSSAAAATTTTASCCTISSFRI